MGEWAQKTLGNLITLQRGFDITKAAQFNIGMVDELNKRSKSKAMKNWAKNKQKLPAI